MQCLKYQISIGFANYPIYEIGKVGHKAIGWVHIEEFDREQGPIYIYVICSVFKKERKKSLVIVFVFHINLVA